MACNFSLCKTSHLKNPNGLEEWFRYNDNWNLIHYKNSEGLEKWFEYDENNSLIHTRDNKGDRNEI